MSLCDMPFTVIRGGFTTVLFMPLLGGCQHTNIGSAARAGHCAPAILQLHTHQIPVQQSVRPGIV